MKRTAVFLDRDGTINIDPGYLGDPDRFQFLPGVIEALKRLRAAGHLIFVVSNQSGIARGFFDREALDRIHDRMSAALEAEGVTLDGVYYCPHHPDEGCACRKPSPAMVLEAARRYKVDLEASFFIGDRASDIQTGRNAGCRTVLVLTGAGGETARSLTGARRPDYVAGNLGEAVAWIINVAGKGTQ
ncbi:MAG: D-glycero-beta-D-manno-heptose 1,7-bisphosphate 7-phosphatase [Candidatus Aureabacteria bacterium]|nr:D-glycero-beta-D-manno-heptose 1,7-bisphosphate 7-phosphatase [Candidatus Auribacterota bacterium]